MHVLSLDVEGYRSLKSVSWKPDQLNMIIGPNGSGKTNLLELLHLLSQSAVGKLHDFVDSQNGIEPLLWDGKARRIFISLKCSPVDSHRSKEQDSLTYQIEIARIGQTSSFRIESELLGNFREVEAGTKPEPFKLLERRRSLARVFDAEQKGFAAPEESVPEDETLLSTASGPFAQNRWLSAFQSELAAWSVYQDVHVERGAQIRLPAMTRNERRLNPDGQNLLTVLHTLYTSDREFERDVNQAMRAAFGADFDKLVFPPAADQRIQLRVRWKTLHTEQPASELSDGTLRFLFLLAVLANPHPPGVIAVDEPETGLHPAMMPLIAEHASDASRRSQVIFTTHSPQLLNFFSDKGAHTTIATWSDGETKLTSPDPATLRHWLREYSLGDLFQSGELESLL